MVSIEISLVLRRKRRRRKRRRRRKGRERRKEGRRKEKKGRKASLGHAYVPIQHLCMVSEQGGNALSVVHDLSQN